MADPAEVHTPKGRPHTRTVTTAKGPAKTFDIILSTGLVSRRRYTVKGEAAMRKAMAKAASNHVRAKAYEAMGGDQVGAAFPTRTRLGQSGRWSHYPA